MLNLQSLKVLALSLALAGCATGEQPATPTLEGYWTGQFQRDGSTLDVELQFTREGDAWRGAFSAASLRAIGIPLREVRQEGDAAHFVLAGDDTTAVFDGRIETGALAGQYIETGRLGEEFIEGEARGSFVLVRQAAPPPACVEAPASFTNGDVTLAGTLLTPLGAGGPFPAVLFAHGSRAQHREAARFEAIALCRAGIASLIYDKRGVNESGGDWRQASFDDLAADAAAGLDWLAARPEIDAARIGVYGHSQGGTIAPLIASRWPRIAFVAAGAGAGLPMGEVERYSLRNAVAPLARDASDRAEAFAFVDRIVEAGATGRGLDQLIADAPRYGDRVWFSAVEPPPRDNFYWAFQRRVAAFDSTVHWRDVRAPVLLLYGENDERVPVEPSIAAIRAALPAGTRVEVVVFEDADHPYNLPRDGPWPRLAPQYPGVLVDFVRRAVGVR